MRWRAEKLNTKGLALEEKGWSREAELAYMRATKTDPHWSVPWFNLGLLAKRQRRWPESLEWNRRAAGINADDEGAWWNMGIAATALAIGTRPAGRGLGSGWRFRLAVVPSSST